MTDTDLERIATEAELRYARTGLTIDAEKAVAARRAVTPEWRRRSLESTTHPFLAVHDVTRDGAA